MINVAQGRRPKEEKNNVLFEFSAALRDTIGILMKNRVELCLSESQVKYDILCSIRVYPRQSAADLLFKDVFNTPA